MFICSLVNMVRTRTMYTPKLAHIISVFTLQKVNSLSSFSPRAKYIFICELFTVLHSSNEHVTELFRLQNNRSLIPNTWAALNILVIYLHLFGSWVSWTTLSFEYVIANVPFVISIFYCSTQIRKIPYCSKF